MNRTIASALLLMIVLLFSACQQPYEQKVIGKVGLPIAEETVESPDDIPEPQADEPTPSLVESADSPNPLQEQVPVNMTPEELEALRIKKYGSLVDLTTIRASQCDGLVFQYDRLEQTQQDALKDLNEDLKERQEDYDQELANLQRVELSGDQLRIASARRSLSTAQDRLDDIEDAIEDKEDYLVEVKYTLDEIEKECKKLQYESETSSQTP